METLEKSDLLRLRETIAPFLHRTPLWRSQALSDLTEHDVLLKCELFQKTGSYKPRGMLWALRSLSAQERDRGVITFSAGNAAQGLAYAAAILKAKAVVTMPETASPAKARAAESYGAEVIRHGTPKECLAHCRELASERGHVMISSYDSLPLMQGHATLGLELVEDLPEADAVFVGVGGGGMLGGLCLAMDAMGSRARVIGVEPAGAPAMTESLQAGRAVSLDVVDTIADGLAAPGAGQACYEIARHRVADMVLVSDAEIAEAMFSLMRYCKLYAEPAGAAALAGLLKHRRELPRKSTVICVVSGGNLDFDRLAALIAAHSK